MSGIDAIKLLLADERLNGKLIEDGDSIFAGGEEALRELASRAKENLNVQILTASGGASECLKPSAISSNVVSLGDTSSEMTEFDEISRNYEEFELTTRVIVDQAERAADMIKFVKNYIRILDTWVGNPAVQDEEVYLHVEENSETIFQRYGDSITVCHRYKNELGEDVYEICTQSSFDMLRFTYIAGKKYEMIYRMNDGARYQGISANNDKGYWEVFDMIYDSGWVEYPFDTNFIIMKDDICYKAGYSLREGSNINYTITTADRKSDLMLIGENSYTTLFDVKLAGFEGYYGVVNIVPGNMGTLKLADGTLIELGELDISGLNDQYTAAINGIYASESAFGCEGSIIITINGEDPAVRRALLMEILASWGISCKYDMSHTFEAVDRAGSEFVMMRKYLKWNGHDVNTMEGLLAGVAVERALFDEFISKYDAIKDAPVVQIGTEAADLLVRFAPIADITCGEISAKGLEVTVSDISLTVNDMLLFVENEEYKIAFAMKSLDEDGGLTHIEVDTAAALYDGADSLTVTAQDLTFMLPMLSPGDYSLVAYVATADGIRSSMYTELGVTNISDEVVKEGNVQATVKSEDGVLKVTYIETPEAVAVIARDEITPYAELYELMAEIAFNYGIPSEDLIQKVDPETMEATALVGDEEDIESGMYMILYTSNSGEKTEQGKLYVEFERIETPEETGTETAEEDTTEDTTEDTSNSGQ
ncbi:MAG: hypothetical protein E7592_00255 [Ruminococcaceae bacterium]|nr:hypothetical protein [Oscillospiraceae bacterium]